MITPLFGLIGLLFGLYMGWLIWGIPTQRLATTLKDTEAERDAIREAHDALIAPIDPEIQDAAERLAQVQIAQIRKEADAEIHQAHATAQANAAAEMAKVARRLMEIESQQLEAPPARRPAPADSGRADASADFSKEELDERQARAAESRKRYTSGSDSPEDPARRFQDLFGTRLPPPGDTFDDFTYHIEGVTPVAEHLLNSIGIQRFEQLAALRGSMLAQVAQAIEIPESRILNENWIGQAKDLLANPPA